MLRPRSNLLGDARVGDEAELRLDGPEVEVEDRWKIVFALEESGVPLAVDVGGVVLLQLAYEFEMAP